MTTASRSVMFHARSLTQFFANLQRRWNVGFRIKGLRMCPGPSCSTPAALPSCLQTCGEDGMYDLGFRVKGSA